MKGVGIGITAQFSGECRAGFVGFVDSLLDLWNHIKIYIPSNLTKFGIAMGDISKASNVMYAYCDMTGMYNELAKLADWENWEQYIELAMRVGGVFI